ncbi:uncharacterized protein LOC121711014 [Alosa sapidissima]|uniref:uncharacterized protein LOC121711014 n=1 Tax=Alosa sapidissima TaxID=34773 RepID=UPI001C09D60F|nr:uncharacterized protein LOC121711014 [Alosa sapidissima]
MDPADSDFSMERLEEVEYTLSRLNSELVKSTDLERRLAISLMERTISSRSWLLKVPGMATLADQLSGLGKSLQSLLGPSSNPVFEATSLPPDPAPPAHCQGLRVGVLRLQPAAQVQNPSLRSSSSPQNSHSSRSLRLPPGGDVVPSIGQHGHPTPCLLCPAQRRPLLCPAQRHPLLCPARSPVARRHACSPVARAGPASAQAMYSLRLNSFSEPVKIKKMS